MSFHCMAAVTICSDSGAPENKVSHCFHCSPSICHEVMGPDAMIFVFWMLSYKPDFSLSYFIFIKSIFSYSLLSAIRVVSSEYLRLLIFLLALMIPACVSSSPAFLMMYSAYKLNKQGNNIKPWRVWQYNHYIWHHTHYIWHHIHYICVITPTVLMTSCPLYVWHHNQRMMTSYALYMASHPFFMTSNHSFYETPPLYSWHQTHIYVVIYDIASTVYGISSSIHVTSQSLYQCHHILCIYDITPTVVMTSYPLYMTSHILCLWQHNHYIWHHTHYIWHHFHCICVIKPTVSMISDSLYVWHCRHCMCGIICAIDNITSIFYDITSTVFMTSQPIYMTSYTLHMTSHPLYTWHLILCIYDIMPTMFMTSYSQ